MHNLLYAYNTDRFKTKEDYLERFPGNEWVDILGFDIYQANNIAKNDAFIGELDQTLGTLESIALEKNKVPALTEFGYAGVPDSSWWSQVFLKAIGHHGVAYALAWRNAGRKSATQFEFYVPYPGQVSADDFVRFYHEPRTLFQQDITKLKVYQ